MDAPAVAVTLDGKKKAAAWMDTRNGPNDRNVYWTMSSGQGFGADAMLHSETKGKQGHPTLVFDEAGVLYAAWEDDRGGGQKIFLATSGNPKNRAVSGEGDAGFPNLASGARMVVLVYETRAGVKFKLISPEK